MADALHPDGRYSGVARGFHWVMVVLILVVLPVGVVIKYIKEDVKLSFYAIHESLGFLLLILVLLRLAYRLFVRRPPPLPADLPPLLQTVAHGVHWALYGLLVVQPVIGFLATNAWGFPLKWFGVIPIPSPLGKDEPVAKILSLIHTTIGWTILALLVVHIGGALYHHVVRKDGVLYRML
ncbi:MAG TPA: cytochrome b/b6 domain-containing protein [Azospirillum sp.]|nr:cytochrome b/b6 domain-containing protein [Azospirillum sp.]